MNLESLLSYAIEPTSNKPSKGMFLSPFYDCVHDAIENKVGVCSVALPEDIVEDLSYQVVSYACENYLKYVYQFELKLSDESGLLEGGTEEDKGRYFRDRLSSSREWVTYFFDKYPKLLTILDSFSDGAICHIDRLLSALKMDTEMHLIEDCQIEEIKLFEGDLHDGCCVSSIMLPNGRRLYYKPRGAANEKFLKDTLMSLSQLGLNIRLGIPTFIDRGCYSWHWQVTACDIPSIDSISEYYNNWGKIQALFFLLGAQDIIPDNIVAVGDCPYLIDCETIVSKKFEYSDNTRLGAYLQSSVIETGILPDWMFDGANRRERISSVLFKFGGSDAHLPHANGKPIPISSETMRNFEDGFSDACDFIMLHKSELSDFFESYDYDGMVSRVLLHPTIIYSFLRREVTTPPYLSGSKSIKELIEPLVRVESYGSLRTRLVESLVAQVECGDVPYYFTCLSKRHLFSLPHDIVIDNWTPDFADGNYTIQKKLSSLSPKTKQEQLCIIDEAINFFIDVQNTGRICRPRVLPSGEDDLDRDALWQAIRVIDKEIRKRLINLDDEIGFVCRTKNVYDGKFQICLMNDSLYDGLLGVCLFYRTLFSFTADCHHKEISTAILRQLCAKKDYGWFGVAPEEIPLSPLSGIMGIMYIMELFPDLYDSAVYSSTVKRVKELIPATIQFDYMSGLAGIVFFAVQSKFMCESDRDSILRLCGERLMELAKTKDGKTFWTYFDGNKVTGEIGMDLGGFAHGSSSLAVAMFLLYKHFSDIRYYEVFERTLLHDRSFYSEEIQGWIDGRNYESGEDSGSWCHGATGVALSRLILVSQGFRDDSIGKELMTAVRQIEKRVGYNLSVCHGSLGNLEVLHLLYGRQDSICRRWVNSIAMEISQGKDIICGDDNRNSQVGLFMGLAGIGYQILKFLDWENVPSILCLELSPGLLLRN